MKSIGNKGAVILSRLILNAALNCSGMGEIYSGIWCPPSIVGPSFTPLFDFADKIPRNADLPRRQFKRRLCLQIGPESILNI